MCASSIRFYSVLFQVVKYNVQEGTLVVLPTVETLDFASQTHHYVEEILYPSLEILLWCFEPRE